MTIKQTEETFLTEKMKKLIHSEGEIVDKVRVKSGELPVKEFAARNSVLTDLYEISHIRTVYHVFLAILVGLFLNTAIYDYVRKQEIRLGLTLIIKGFGRLHIALLIWGCLFLTSLLIYSGFKFWAKIRIRLSPKSASLKLWDYFCLAAFVMYYPSLLYFSSRAIISCDLAIAESLALTMETTRFLMKMHAFVRTNTPRALKYKLHTEDQILCPDFSKFLYFCFAPTLIYKDDYPRSAQIRWKYVSVCFLEVLGVIIFLSFVLERFFIPDLKDYGLKPMQWDDIVLIVLGNSAAAMLILLTVFYVILHAWMNGFAEMLRFSDRMFYKDWWTSPTYDRYYRTWNSVVHDWLYTYIYKDFYEIVLPKNKLAAKYIVFFTSAIFHDYILTISFRFYLPILFIQFFGIGVFMSFLKFRIRLIGNVFLWYTLALGVSINVCAFTMEYYARVNCPIDNITLSSYFIPRFLSCNK